MLGGLATGDVSTTAVYRVDPASGSTTLVGHLPLAVHDAAGGAIGGKALVFGGGGAATTAIVQSWSPATSAETASLPRPRSDLASATIDGTTFLVGGFDGSTLDAVVLATSDGKSFVPKGTLVQPVRYPAVAAADGAVWVIGGVTGTSEGSTADTDTIQRIDARTGQTTVVGHLPMPLGHASAVDVGGELVVAGGRTGTAPSDQVLRIDTVTGAVTPVGTLPGPRSDAGATVVGDTAYLLGGEVSGPTHPLNSVVELHAAP
jgi:non-specific serine/threonine protein kinase